MSSNCCSRKTLEGRSVYHINFRPKDKNELTWAGEAYIEAAEFQRARVFTKLSRRISFAVRMLLGADLPGIGFNMFTAAGGWHLVARDLRDGVTDSRIVLHQSGCCYLVEKHGLSTYAYGKQNESGRAGGLGRQVPGS